MLAFYRRVFVEVVERNDTDEWKPSPPRGPLDDAIRGSGEKSITVGCDVVERGDSPPVAIADATSTLLGVVVTERCSIYSDEPSPNGRAD